MFPFDLQTQPLAHALGRAILHSLWQGAAVAGLLAAALSMLRGRGANVRYALSCAALALMLLLPAATVWRVSGTAQDSLAAEESAPARAKREQKFMSDGGAVHADESAAVESRASSIRRTDAFGIKSMLPWLSLVWLTGVAVLLARMLGGLVYARRLRRRGVSPVGEFWQERARDISRRLRLARAVRVLESTLVQVPTAVGWLRPVVLLPASALVLGRPMPPARGLVDAGTAVALATNFNPGSAFCESLPLVCALAATQLKLTPAEALAAVTVNAAHVLGRAEQVGRLAPGYRADCVLLDAPDWRYLAYHLGGELVKTVVLGGEAVAVR